MSNTRQCPFTREQAALINGALAVLYDRLTGILGPHNLPIPVLTLTEDGYMPRPITATLTAREWRLLRFCVEQARLHL